MAQATSSLPSSDSKNQTGNWSKAIWSSLLESRKVTSIPGHLGDTSKDLGRLPTGTETSGVWAKDTSPTEWLGQDYFLTLKHEFYNLTPTHRTVEHLRFMQQPIPLPASAAWIACSVVITNI